MPERFKVVFIMQGAIQVFGFTFPSVTLLVTLLNITDRRAFSLRQLIGLLGAVK